MYRGYFPYLWRRQFLYKDTRNYEDYNVEYSDDTETYNSVNLFTGDHVWISIGSKVEKYNKEMEIIVDPKQDFISWI